MAVHPPYEFIADGLKAGDVIPFFGAAASAVYRPQNERWVSGAQFMPFGDELATTLASAAQYPGTDDEYEAALSEILASLQGIAVGVTREQAEAALKPALSKHFGRPPDLAFVASWAEHVQGNRRAIDRKLRKSFAVESHPGSLHTMLGAIPGTKFYVTTNYDDLLEKALASRQPHLMVDRGENGLWVNKANEKPRRVAATGNDLYELLNDPHTQQPSHPIVFKMHGSVDKDNEQNDSYLITEEDYVDFLGRAGGSYVPPYVNGLMKDKNFLLLGYSLADWNVRVILRKLLKQATRDSVRFWAIVNGHSDIQQELWQAHKLNIYPMDLLTFADELAKHL
jgi:hypothetical protein